MKKTILVFAIVLISVSMYSQESSMSAAQGGPASRAIVDNEFQCLANSVFSQVHPTFNNAYFCDNLTGYCLKVSDDYTASAPFNTMRLWGGNFSCVPGISQTFIIEFYNGIPGSGGTVVNSFTKTITPQPTGIIAPFMGNPETYMVDVDFGTTISQLSGWVSISRINPGDGCAFAWIASSDIGGSSLSYCSDNWINSNGELFFCLGLGGGSPLDIPLNGWALFIGITLITMIAIIRFRKII